jgi:hypothetical protein
MDQLFKFIFKSSFIILKINETNMNYLKSNLIFFIKLNKFIFSLLYFILFHLFLLQLFFKNNQFNIKQNFL